MEKIVTTVLALCVAAGFWSVQPAVSADDGYNIVGKYKQIKPVRPLQPSDKVEVIGAFWYGCPHCYQFLPYLQHWQQTDMPDYVELRRLPAIFRDSWAVHAKAYYAALALDLEDELHVSIFDALHSEKRPLNTRLELRKFFVEHGVSTADFGQAFDSFGVDAKTRESQMITRSWAFKERLQSLLMVETSSLLARQGRTTT